MAAEKVICKLSSHLMSACHSLARQRKYCYDLLTIRRGIVTQTWNKLRLRNSTLTGRICTLTDSYGSSPLSRGNIGQIYNLLKSSSSCGVLRTTCVSGYETRGIHTSQGPKSFQEDHKTKDLTVWGSLKEVKSSPLPALTLGLAGLIPFVSAPAYLITLQQYLPDVGVAQAAYGAVILSFLGGLRWGFTLPEENPVKPDWVNLGYSVTPSLIAWAGLLMPLPMSLLTIMGGLGFSAYFDMSMYGYPAWFKGLRFLLSVVAILSLWSTFMCSLILNRRPVETSDHEKSD